MRPYSRTNLAIQKYYEQIAPEFQDLPDATSTEEVGEPEPESDTQPLTSEGERYLVELLVKAFAHIPNESELKVVDGFQSEYLQDNPKEVAETIQNLLQTSPESFEQTLNSYR